MKLSLKQILILVTTLTLLITLMGCNTPTLETSITEPTTMPTTSEPAPTPPEETTVPTELGFVYKSSAPINIDTEDVLLSYAGYSQITSNGKTLLLVYFDFTNKNPGKTSAQTLFQITATQNEEALEKATEMEDLPELNTFYSDVKEGETVIIAVAFHLPDPRSDVQLEIALLPDVGQTYNQEFVASAVKSN